MRYLYFPVGHNGTHSYNLYFLIFIINSLESFSLNLNQSHDSFGNDISVWYVDLTDVTTMILVSSIHVHALINVYVNI